MKKSVLPLIALFLFSACATHSTMRGGVAMKVSDREAHVCLGEGEVKEGDKVEAFYNDCQDRIVGGSKDGGAYGVPCVKKKLGKGIVVKTLNEHYSVVEFDEGVKFSEGTFVEKK